MKPTKIVLAAGLLIATALAARAALDGVTPPVDLSQYGGTLPILLPKLAAAPTTAPGAGRVTVFAVAGTNAGTCKLQVLAGTSTTPFTLGDNIGGGC